MARRSRFAGVGGNGFGDAMGRENHRRLGVGNFRQLFDENRALGLEHLDDVAVVNDLMPHVNGRPENRQRALHGVDGALDPGAKAARRTKKNFERRFLAPRLHIHFRAFRKELHCPRPNAGERPFRKSAGRARWRELM